MRLVVSIIVVCITVSMLAPQAHGIIFLPAVVLIPIAKIVALIIGGFAFPALGVGVLWSKLFGASLGRVMSVAIIILVILAMVLTIFFKLYSPERPMF